LAALDELDEELEDELKEGLEEHGEIGMAVAPAFFRKIMTIPAQIAGRSSSLMLVPRL